MVSFLLYAEILYLSCNARLAGKDGRYLHLQLLCDHPGHHPRLDY